MGGILIIAQKQGPLPALAFTEFSNSVHNEKGVKFPEAQKNQEKEEAGSLSLLPSFEGRILPKSVSHDSF